MWLTVRWVIAASVLRLGQHIPLRSAKLARATYTITALGLTLAVSAVRTEAGIRENRSEVAISEETDGAT